MAPRPLQPPSSYRPAAAAQPAPQPVAAGAPSTSNRRLSRTELDFEQALRTGGTVLLKEERDFSSLGKLDSPSALSTISASPAGSPYYDYSFMSPSSPTPNSSRHHQQAPATVKRNHLAAPGVVPPTPTPTTHSNNNNQVTAPTPTTIHITTMATAGTSSSSSSRPVQPPTPSPSSSSDVFFDAEEGDMQTRRRSMYRAPGTSSSPDLATLLRKTKEKGSGSNPSSTNAAAIAAARSRDKRYDQQDLGPPPPLPGSTNAGLFPPSPAGMRQRSSTAVGGLSMVTSPQATPMRTKKDSFGPASPDWVLTSKASKQSLRDIKGKTSVRQKATAFVGRVLGQGSSRDRSLQRTDGGISSSDAPSRSSHSLFDAFAPPVPPIPLQHRTLPAPPINDIFSQSQHPAASKPLPPIIKPSVEAPSDGETTEPEDFLRSPTRKPRPPSDQTIGKWRPDASSETVTARHNKRRSMSVGEMELKLAMSAASSMTPLPSTAENTPNRDRSTPQPSRHQRQSAASRAGHNRDPSLKGILNDFQGELLQLDAPSTPSFDLKDPSTPARRAALARSRTEADATTCRPSLFSRNHQQQPHKSQTAPLLPTTTTTGLQSAVVYQGVDRVSLVDSLKSASTSSGGQQDGMAAGGHSTLVPPRTSSSSLRAADITHPVLAAAMGSTTSPPTTNTNTGTRTQLTASSEPSLLPDVRIVSSSGASSVGGGGSSIGIGGSSSASSSRVDFSSSASIASSDRLGRYPSSSYARRRRTMSQDGLDMDAKGRDLAGKCWAEDEEFLMKEKIAEWLGGHGRINKIALRYYMEFFDFSGLRLDKAFRRLCEKLYLKAETQQVDRILDEFGKRYWDCNPNALYGSASVVHSVSYSLLLLNTDLHVAELSTRMSRNQFVRNTMSTIQMSLEPQPTATATSSSINLSRPSNARQLSSSDLTYDDCGSSIREELEGNTVRTKRSSSVASWNSGSRDTVLSSPPTEYSPAPGSGVATANGANGSGGGGGGGSSAAASSTSVLPTTIAFSGPGGSDAKSTDGNGHGHNATTTTVSSAVYGRLWETDMENLLKEMYHAIKSQQILQPQGSMVGGRASTSVLNQGQGHTLMRNRSVRGGPPDRLTSLKRGSIRGLHSIMGNQAGVSPYSSNSSIDGRSSPAPSFANSAHEALQSNPAFMAPTLGFASNLSHTIIRELQEDDDHSVKSHETGSTEISMTDEELALLGAPWAKEGNLCRKQYWESTGKRAKDRNWLDVFVVIQRGELNMFVFGDHHAGSRGVVGGGNWLENANTVGTIHLAHSLAHALPPPGYNRQRPYCMVLTLSNGGVYFFQAGTEELVKEWVDTCNYWAARTSREPLAGGVSNMEYGWNRVLNQQRQHPQGRAVSDSESVHAPEPVDNFDTASVRSGRSSRSRFGGRREASALRAPGSPLSDRTFINDWTPPMPSMVPSAHDEEGQYDALKRHVESLKTELEKHNELRSPMMALYQPRTANASKAQNNWEKKSQHLLSEIIKYESYIDSLNTAMLLRSKRRGDKALERALVVASPDEDSEDQAHTEINHGAATVKAGKNGRWRSGSNVESIEEVNTPPETPQAPQFNISRMHRREIAEADT